MSKEGVREHGGKGDGRGSGGESGGGTYMGEGSTLFSILVH